MMFLHHVVIESLCMHTFFNFIRTQFFKKITMYSIFRVEIKSILKISLNMFYLFLTLRATFSITSKNQFIGKIDLAY